MKSITHVIREALGDGARNTKFDALFITKDTTGYDNRYLSILCKSASFPGISHSKIDFMYKGRTIPVRGQTSYSQSWSASFYLDENHESKKIFDLWILTIDERHSYVDDADPEYHKKERIGTGMMYTRDITIYQQSFDDSHKTAGYVLHNAFPIEVGDVEVSSEGPSSVLTFNVTFAYSHWTAIDCGGSSAISASGGSLASSAISSILGGSKDASPLREPMLKKLASGAGELVAAKVGSFADNVASDMGVPSVGSLVKKGTSAVMGSSVGSLASSIGPMASSLTEGLSVPTPPMGALSNLPSIGGAKDMQSVLNSVTALAPKPSALEIASALSDKSGLGGKLGSLTGGVAGMAGQAMGMASGMAGQAMGMASGMANQAMGQIGNKVGGLF